MELQIKRKNLSSQSVNIWIACWSAPLNALSLGFSKFWMMILRTAKNAQFRFILMPEPCISLCPTFKSSIFETSVSLNWTFHERLSIVYEYRHIETARDSRICIHWSLNNEWPSGLYEVSVCKLYQYVERSKYKDQSCLIASLFQTWLCSLMSFISTSMK